jgi:hypothetical protein
MVETAFRALPSSEDVPGMESVNRDLHLGNRSRFCVRDRFRRRINQFADEEARPSLRSFCSLWPGFNHERGAPVIHYRDLDGCAREHE